MWLLFTIFVSLAPVVPVSGPVIEGFRPPACERCAGRRGVVIGSQAGSPVRAVTTGPVTFGGTVGGLIYVVQQIAPRVRVTYGWLSTMSDVQPGDQLNPGQVLGTAGQRTYLGVRVGQTYVEPLRYLGWGGARLRGPGGVIVGARPPSR
jgi:murein DD-endopeptidase MepM/ murein hydrolase activator NlpD